MGRTNILAAALVAFFLVFISSASAVTYIDSCQTLNTEAETFVMNASIADRVGSCFLISANNITLDCANFEIDGDLTGTDYGIQVTLGINNTIIQNCSIKEFANNLRISSASSSSNTVIRNLTSRISTAEGFYSIDTSGIDIDGMTISDSRSYGFYARTSSNFIVKNINAHNNTRYEIYFDRVNSTYVENVDIYGTRATSTSYPIYYVASKDHILKNVRVHDNVIGSYSMVGIRASTVINMTLENATVFNLGALNPLSGYTTVGIEMNSVNNSVIKLCEVYNVTLRSLAINSGINNLVKDSYFHAYDGAEYGGQEIRLSIPTGQPIYCDNIVENVKVTGNRTYYFFNYSTTIENVEVGAIHLCDADGSVIRNVTVISPIGSLGNYIRLEYTDDTNISDSTINGGDFLVYYSFGVRASNIELYNCSSEHMNPAITGVNICNRFPVGIMNSSIVLDSLNLHGSTYGICFPAGFSDATITNTGINATNESLRVDSGTASGYSYVNIYDSSLHGLINMTCLVGGCIQRSVINLYNTTYDFYDIAPNFTSLNVYWKLVVTNPLDASILIYNLTGDEVASFSDSRSIWLADYYVESANIRTNSTPHNLSASKTDYVPAEWLFNMTSSFPLVILLSEVPPPPSTMFTDLLGGAGSGIANLLNSITDPTVALVLGLGMVVVVVMILLSIFVVFSYFGRHEEKVE